MNFDQLNCFLTVEKYRSFTDASEILFITQSAISKQIKRLEDELGTPLFRRDSRTIDLTEAGRYFLPMAEKMVSLYNRTISNMEEFSVDKRKAISVCIEPGSWAYGIPELMQEYIREHPETEITIRERSAESIIERLDNGTSDLVFTWIDELPGEKYTVIPIIADPAVVITHPESRLAGREVIKPIELKDERIAMLARDINRIYYVFLEELGLQDRISFDFIRTESLFNVASSGAGVAMVLGERADRWRNSDISIVRIEGDPIVYHYSAAMSNDMHSRKKAGVIRDLIAYLTENLSKKKFKYASVIKRN
ncbi:MAG: LysR family transcriptional regulator [Lachnospiraceae bacterium]|nr:LysR family transcriptional regulator [Lachnospiraceae bacterium]